LERIERLAAAASAGPWISYVVGRETDAFWNCIELGTCTELGSFKSIELTGGTVADQDFIAGARQYLPRLVLEVRKLKARLDSTCAAQGLVLRNLPDRCTRDLDSSPAGLRQPSLT
jgi:hypothetical protein